MITARPILMAAPMVRSTIKGRKTQTRLCVSPGNIRFLRGGINEPIVKYSPAQQCLDEALSDPRNMRFIDNLLTWDCPDSAYVLAEPKYQVGDLLWVKETWAVGKCADGLKPRELSRRCWIYENGGLWYEGQEPTHPISPRGAPRSSMFMPRWASRLTLELTDVRVERLQNISEEDAEAEGIEYAIRPFGDWKLIPGIWDFEGLVNDGEQRCDPPPAIKYAYLWNSINAKAGTRWADNPWVWVLTFAVHHANVDAVLAQLTEVAA